MNQKTCKKLRAIALRMGGGKTTIGIRVKTDERGRKTSQQVDFYEELKRRHAALPRNIRGVMLQAALRAVTDEKEIQL